MNLMAEQITNIKKFYTRLEDFWNTDKYTDVTIKCGNKNFKCHRLVLAATCDYFDAMFGGQFCERTSKNISLQEVGLNAEIFELVLQFIYTGDTQIHSKNILSLFHASEFFKLSGIEDLCVRFVKENGVTVQDTLDIFMFASATKKQSLIDLLGVHIAKNFEIFSKISSFLQIPFDDFKKILVHFTWSSMRNEEALLSAITRWIHHQREERLQYFNEFVKMIRFENISSTYMQFMFTKFFLDTHNDALTQTLKPIGYSEDSVLHEGVNSPTKTSLHVIVKHEKEKFMKVYSINNALDCSISDWVPSTDSLHLNRNVASDNFYLYSLHYSQHCRQMENSSLFEQTFCAYTLINASSELRLKTPPTNFYGVGTSLCATKNNIYAYYKCSTSIVNQEISSNLFNAEEIKRGICVYNCEVDDWFPVPEMKKRMYGACITAHNDLIYLIGGMSLDTSQIPSYAQLYDNRIGKWQELPKAHFGHVRAACCSLKDKIYVCGGKNVTQVERYDPVAGKWQKLLCSSLRKPMIYHRLVPYWNKLWLMGSQSYSTEQNTRTYVASSDLNIDVFNPETFTWSTASILKDKNTYGSGSIIDAVIFKP